MNVLMVSPGFPAEMPRFTRGLAQVGANVVGLSDQPAEALPELARTHLADHIHVPSLWDERAVVEIVEQHARRRPLDRVECLWEPGLVLAARLREALGLPGMSVEQTLPFRDKELMKQRLDAAGIRTPHHYRARTVEEVREGVERIGYPIIIKPIAGAGATDTYRIDRPQDLEQVLPRIRHVPEVSVEEFVEAEEFTYDTISINGAVLHFNVAWYRPRPLIDKLVEWVSPQTIALRDVAAEELQVGIEMGRKVLRALDFQTGYTHMEWYRRPDGSAVFGEIGARAPGARLVDIINFSCDIDTYVGWAEAVCHGRFSQRVERKYNAATVFKRAQGQGRIQRIEGLERLMAEFGEFICGVDLLPIGAPRRDWKQVIVSDGIIYVRHPDLQQLLHMADRIGTDLQLFAG
ncbi:MAG: ATP-grasp domain-containing protein [Acidobacteriota bacterium]|nr:MAG: ATP-grasp domain-containing protein [Acidobacteriota bacterium]